MRMMHSKWVWWCMHVWMVECHLLFLSLVIAFCGWKMLQCNDSGNATENSKYHTNANDKALKRESSRESPVTVHWHHKRSLHYTRSISVRVVIIVYQWMTSCYTYGPINKHRNLRIVHTNLFHIKSLLAVHVYLLLTQSNCVCVPCRAVPCSVIAWKLIADRCSAISR